MLRTCIAYHLSLRKLKMDKPQCTINNMMLKMMIFSNFLNEKLTIINRERYTQIYLMNIIILLRDKTSKNLL